jgi:putative transposase
MPPHGISRATVEALRVKYGGARVAQARRLKVLEEQYGLIKRLLPDAMLDNAVLNEVAGKLVEFAAQWGGYRGCSTAIRHQRALVCTIFDVGGTSVR